MRAAPQRAKGINWIHQKAGVWERGVKTKKEKDGADRKTQMQNANISVKPKTENSIFRFHLVFVASFVHQPVQNSSFQQR